MVDGLIKASSMVLLHSVPQDAGFRYWARLRPGPDLIMPFWRARVAR